MKPDDIIALCIGVPCLISLIAILWYMAIKMANQEKEYKAKKIKMYEAITKYIENKEK